MSEKKTLFGFVVAAAATAAIGLAVKNLAPLVWLQLMRLLSFAWSTSTASVAVPVWLLVPLTLLACVPVARILFRFFEDAGPTFRDYTEDHFYGLKWRWRYSISSGRPSEPCPFCPDDDTLLTYTNSDRYLPPKVMLNCDTCGQSFGPYEGHWRDLEGRIERFIDRKIRSEEWKETLDQDPKT